MFLAYCRNPADDSWTPPVICRTAREAYRYCALHHVWAPEIRVTDEEDYVVLHMEAHVLKVPMPDGSLRERPLTQELVTMIMQMPEETP